MSQDNPLFDLTFKAGADLSADAAPTTSLRYRALKTDGSNARQVVAVSGVSDRVIGIQQNLPESGQFVDVRHLGTSRVRVAAAVAAGDYLKVDAAGKFITGGAGADINWAIALEAGAADGDLVEAVLLQPQRVT